MEGIREKKSGILRVEGIVLGEKRVMFLGSGDIYMRRRKLESDLRLKRLTGRLKKMVETYHTKEVRVEEQCLCEEKDIDDVVEAWGTKYAGEGWKVYSGYLDDVGKLKVVVYDRKWKDLLDEVVEKARERGEESVRDLLNSVHYGE
jgi:hypothetical protein